MGRYAKAVNIKPTDTFNVANHAGTRYYAYSLSETCENHIESGSRSINLGRAGDILIDISGTGARCKFGT